jgi:hypothetical protein
LLLTSLFLTKHQGFRRELHPRGKPHGCTLFL